MLAALSDLSRGKARRLIEAGGVYVDGKRCLRLSAEIGPGARLDAVLHAEEAAERATARLAERAPSFVHREHSFAVLHKPPGIAVQASRATVRGTLEAWLRDQEGVHYVAFHHRLDAPARGLIAVALHPSANKGLAAAFRERTAERTYRALVEGRLEGEGLWEHSQVQRSGTRRAVKPRSGGKLMRSHWRTLAAGERSLIEVRLETGRTHQIRLQAAAVGHPVVGDLLYGASDRGGLHLQAGILALPHPKSGARREWSLEPPAAWVPASGVPGAELGGD